MARRVECPLPDYPDGWIELPDKWLGQHANTRDEILEKLGKLEPAPKPVHFNWMVALSLLDDWGGISAMEGNPENWDYATMPLELIAWINNTVLGSFNECFTVKKKY